jgi:metal-responsive CopG/Arc/MetJ family transcriptional regulator
MKPVVSIPSELLAALERLAQEAGVSPSQLHELALREFIARHNPDGLTAQMNRALDEIGSQEDEFQKRAAQRALERVEW